MAETKLTFTKKESRYVTNFTSGGNCVVQIQRREESYLHVLANIPGMDPVRIDKLDPYSDNIFFSLKVPAGLEVTIESGSEVSSAKLFTE